MHYTISLEQYLILFNKDAKIIGKLKLKKQINRDLICYFATMLAVKVFRTKIQSFIKQSVPAKMAIGNITSKDPWRNSKIYGINMGLNDWSFSSKAFSLPTAHF